MKLSKNSIYVLLIDNDGKRDAGILTQLKYLSGCYYFSSSRNITSGNCYDNGGKYYNSISEAIIHWIDHNIVVSNETFYGRVFHFWPDDAENAYHFMSEYLIDGRCENSNCIELLYKDNKIHVKYDIPEVANVSDIS